MPRMDKLSNYRTTVVCTNGRISVIYVSTEIVLVAGDLITLSSGGYETVTTKRKMNQASHQFGLGYGVAQRKGKWFVTFRDGRPDIEFIDGMSFERFQQHPTPVEKREELRNEVTNTGDC